MLLDHKRTIIDIVYGYAGTALDTAMHGRPVDCINAILLHSRVPDEDRIQALKRFYPQLGLPKEDFIAVVQTVLGHVKVVPLDDLLELIDLHAQFNPDRTFLLGLYLNKLLQQDTEMWKSLQHPYHLAARTGNQQALQRLIDLKADPSGLDDDNWTSVDVARAYNFAPFAEQLVKLVQPLLSKGYKKPGFNRPSKLVLPSIALEEVTALSRCEANGHDTCGVHGRLHVSVMFGKEVSN